ncbi:MAG: ATP-binding protein [Candidatus Limnocylindrales bacterium]
MTEPDAREGRPIANGALAFLFTDIAGSTRLWEQSPEDMRDALARHDTILREAVEASAGRVVKSTGDGLMAVFPNAADGVAAAMSAQQGLAAEPWRETGPLRVRMALHAGDAERRGEDYFGPTVNRTARLMAAGHGGQVLLSAAAAALAADRLPDGASLRDLGEYRLKDLGRPERVFQLLHPALEVSFPLLTTMDRSAANLPVPAAPFVGRRLELAEVDRRLEDPAIRLLTLTGPGGTGKTSLGVRAAGDQVERFRDGVSFVDLSTTRDTDSVLLALGRVVGVGEAPDRPLRQELTDRLRDRQILLLLDNFEQVTAAAGVTTELLGDCPELKLLVTSREPLHVRAEHVYAVPPMTLPPVHRGPVSAEQLGQYEAVQLFVDRARAVRPDFRLDDDNAAAVGEICRRLDGLPLAIELAAARLRLFSPEALRDRLGSRLELLRSSTRDLPERQQTLRATIEWSYQLLEPGEQRVFESLAAFAGGDLPAVEAVFAAAAGHAEPEVDVVEALASLLEKSLIRQVDVAHAEPRLLMLETIREYATERLDERPAGPAIRRAHATYYADLAARLRGDLAGPARDQAMVRMAAEVENLRLAWRYWIAEADLAQLTKLADSLLILDEARGWYHDTVELTTNLLSVLAETTSTRELVGQEIALRMTLARALLATRGFTPEVAEAYARALQLFEGGREIRQHFSILRGLASLYMLRTEFDKALDLGKRILALAEGENDPNMRIDGHLVVGSTLAFTGDLHGGLRHLDAAIGLFEASGDRAVGSRLGNDPRVTCLTTSAFVLWLLGFPDRAAERATAAIDLARRLDHPYTSAYAYFHAGLLHMWRREPEIVLDRALRLLEIADEFDFRIWSAIGSCLLGAAQTALGRVDVGLAQVREGMANYQGLVTPPVFWPLLLSLDSGASGRAGLPAQGLGPINTAITLMGSGPDAILLPDLLLLKGDLLSDLAATGAEAPTEAASAYEQALERARHVGARMPELRATTRLCRLAPGGEQRVRDLQMVLETFTEGFATADLIEARAVLAEASSRS